ncbi:asparaginase [Peptostreptococcus equinus]|uniref:asparaginase n=1 Tax=Peptostreptococcus equinus TaxID=3003601 RepID=A0ABY7JMX1_9FIRM|nr:asparaginase [Peptostreptococcus sp. CBA3647]WAW14435.1 asparaginase [Peptostreptococcus sp. CBA3647]
MIVIRKNILLIATGGTIASKPTEFGLMPSITSEEILRHVPQIAEFCEVTTVQLMNIDSSHMSPNRWIQIVECVRENYEKYDGFVITHGTDTLAYSASALSYLIQNSTKPIVMTGSQKSIYLQDTDARKNLKDAFIYACDDKANGVKIVFDSKVILGTRARKTRTHSYNAFDSVDYPIIAIIFNDKVVYYIEEEINNNVIFYDKLNTDVNIIKLVPGIHPEIFDFIGEKSDVIIIEGFGVGGLPDYDGKNTLAKKVKKLIDSGKIIVFSTSVPHEGSNIEVYEVGNVIKSNFGILENYNMTIESTVCKLMWITAQYKDIKKVKEVFYTPISHDIVL